MSLDKRKQKIFLAIIRDYITTAEPVGSRTIAKKYNLGVSPATIRNEMADLEEMGYIEQPHTSAGRVPSDIGYRYYVDCLMKRKKLTEEEVKAILNGYKIKVREIGAVLHETNKIMSEITNYTAIALGPQFKKCNLRHVQLMPYDAGKAVVVVVTDGGMVQSRVIDIPESINEIDLQKISQVMNAKLQGLSLEHIKLTLIKEIYLELSKHKNILNDAMELIQETLNISSDEDHVYLAGAINMLNQPEFRNIDKLKTLLSLLEQGKVLKNILKGDKWVDKRINVTIGGENKMQELRDCSVITATYQISGEVAGSVGVIGPTRMDYEKAISIVDFITMHLSNIMKDFYGHR